MGIPKQIKRNVNVKVYSKEEGYSIHIQKVNFIFRQDIKLNGKSIPVICTELGHCRDSNKISSIRRKKEINVLINKSMLYSKFYMSSKAINTIIDLLETKLNEGIIPSLY